MTLACLSGSLVKSRPQWNRRLALMRCLWWNFMSLDIRPHLGLPLRYVVAGLSAPSSSTCAI